MIDGTIYLEGKVNIPAEKRDEMNRCVLEILDKCGIRKTVKMTVAGVEVTAVSPAQPNAEGIVLFDYSIFEKRQRKISAYDLNTCELDTKEQRYGMYGGVMNMIMVLQEAYTNGGCYLVRSGKLCDAKSELRLLQGVLGKRITLPGRLRLWDTYLFFRNSEECKDITCEDLVAACSEDCGAIDTEQLLAVLEVEAQKLILLNEKPIFCREEIASAGPGSRAEYAYKIFCGMKEDEENIMESFLAELLDSDFSERKELSARQDEMGIIAELSLYVLPARLVLAYAQAVEGDFWDIWNSFGSKGYSDIIQKDNRRETEPVFCKYPFYSTLMRDDEDVFLEFWDGSNLRLSRNMKQCIQRWKEEFNGISVPPDMSAENFLAQIAIRMKNSNCRYVDKSFVTEFTEQGDDLNHQKALILLERVLDDKGQRYFPELTGEQADEWIIHGERGRFDCEAISALSSLLTNKTQRKKLFGF